MRAGVPKPETEQVHQDTYGAPPNGSLYIGQLAFQVNAVFHLESKVILGKQIMRFSIHKRNLLKSFMALDAGLGIFLYYNKKPQLSALDVLQHRQMTRLHPSKQLQGTL